MSQRFRFPAAYPEIPTDLSAAMQSLVAARTELEAARAANLAAVGRGDEVRKALHTAEYAALALEVGVPVDAAELGLPAATVAAARHAPSKPKPSWSGSSPSVNHLQGPPRRLVEALAILEDDRVAEPHAGRPRPPRRGASALSLRPLPEPRVQPPRCTADDAPDGAFPPAQRLPGRQRSRIKTTGERPAPRRVGAAPRSRIVG